MSIHKLRRVYNDVLDGWGFFGDNKRDVPRVVLVDNKFIRNLARNITLLASLIERLAQNNELSIGPASDYYTRGIGKTQSIIPTPFIARPDLVVSGGEPKLLEMNVDSSLGGMVEVSKLAEAFNKSGCYSNNVIFQSPLKGMANLLSSVVRDKDGSIVILSSRNFLPYDVKNIEYMAEELEANIKRNVHVAYVDELEIKEAIYWNGRPVCAMIKMDVMIEEGGRSELGNLLEEAKCGATAIISDNVFIQVEDKGSISKLRRMCNEESGNISDEEKSAIKSMTVPTALLGEKVPIGYSDWFEYVVKHRKALVLKRCFSFGGSTVAVGASCSPRMWKERIRDALDEPDVWLVQQYLSSDALVFEGCYGGFNAAARAGVDTASVISPFVFQKEISGFLCRTSRSPENRVIGLGSDAIKGFYMVGEEREKRHGKM